jgi:hypothetical protein
MSPSKNTKFTKVSISGDVEESEYIQKKLSKRKSLGLPPEYLNLGFYFVVPLLLAIFVGRYLDIKFGTRSLFTLSFIIIGTISIFYNLYKLYSKDESTHKH